MTTLVMGAGGTVGRHVLAGLLDLARPVRASARRPDPAGFPAGVDLVAADLTDADSLLAAFDGVEQVFTYAQPDSAGRVADAARAAGVRRIVLLSSGSVLQPTAAGNPITEEHRAVEAAFAAAAGLTVVPIRPLVLAGNSLGWARGIRTGRTARLYRPDAPTAPVHERDVAAVAVAALTGARNVSGTLTGPRRITQRAQAEAIGRALGEPVDVVELSADEALTHYRRFLPEQDARAVLRFVEDAAEGHSPATDVVPEVLGRKAIGFDEWAREHAGEFR